ncbi:MAG: divergent polysaccharide deacetylase family protein, partial [Armatimonadota bacterium]|nr:divergent polysaccharide deacetylase family protein [Armatimonadota bacterium]
RPEGRGQVLEVGLEHQGKVLPVLRVHLRPSEDKSSPQVRVAVVLDDAGMRLDELDRALRVGRPLTLAILPGLPHSEELARRARQAGLEVLLHLPMEPEDPELASQLGELAVRVDMAEEDIVRTVKSALRAVPGAVGVNNHMGSKATADPRVMRAVLRALREDGMFFVDSRTTPKSSAEVVAKELGVRVARRMVFLDNDPSPEAVRTQIRQLVELARRHGSAVAIGHANRPHTAEVLAEMVPEMERAGVRLVPVGELAR